MSKSKKAYEELGFWSSHPAAQRKSRKVFLLLSLLPLLLYIAVLVLVCSDFDACRFALMHPGLPLKIFAVVACATAGAIFCLCMMDFLPFVKFPFEKGEDKDRRPFQWWGIFIFALAWILPWLLSRIRNSIWDGPYFGAIEFVLNLLCLAPFFWMCGFLLMCRKHKSVENAFKAQFKPLIIGIVSLLLAAVPFFVDIHGAIAALLPNIPIVQKIHNSLYRIILFGLFFPIGTMFLSLWRMIKLFRTDSVQEHMAEEDEGNQADSKDEAAILGVLNDFIAAREAADVCWTAEPSKLPRRDNSSDNSDEGDSVNRSDYQVLMRGNCPTSVQAEFLSYFNAAYEEYITTIGNGDRECERPLDIIIGGADGSGRTEALCAAAILAVLSRGDKVLFIVKDNLAAKIVCHRINEMLRLMLLSEEANQYIAVRHLERNDFSKWIRDKHPLAAAPAILVAHPGALERETFSADFNTEQHLVAADILLEYSTILVDDVFEHTDSVLAHLVFLIKKLRLLLSANGRFSQLVVAAPQGRAPETIRAAFPLKNDKAKTFLFASRDDVEIWCGKMKFGGTSTAIEEAAKIANFCAKKGLKVAVFNPLVEQAGTHAGFSRGAILIQVMGEWELCKPRMEPDVVICPFVDDDETTAMLRNNMMVNGSYLVYVEDGKRTAIPKRPLTRLLPDNTSKTLCHAHLRSLLPFLLPKLPMSERLWNLFGIRWAEDIPDANPSENPVNVIDWAYDALLGNGYDIKKQLALLTNYTSQSVKIDYSSLPNVQESVWRSGTTLTDADRKVHLGIQGGDDRVGLSRHAKWRDGSKNDLGITDLANCTELVCRQFGNRYCCDAIIRSPAEGYAMLLKGKPLQEVRSDRDPIIPVRGIAWKSPDTCEIGGAKTDWDCRLARFFVAGEDGTPLPTHVSCCLTGVMDSLGHWQDLDIIEDGSQGKKAEYSFHATITGLVLSPVDNIFQLPKQSLVGREWDLDRRHGYSPCLTHALTAAFSSRFDGFNFYASLLAFVTRGDRERVGDVVIWIVEPENTGRTCSNKILETFNDSDELTVELLQDALCLIKEARNEDIAKLRILSGVAYSEENLDANDADEACDILEGVLRPLAERKKEDEDNKERIRLFREGRRDRRRITTDREQEEEFDSVLEKGLMCFTEEVDVSQFAKAKEDGGYGWDIHRIANSCDDFMWNHPEAIHVGKNWRFSFQASGNAKKTIIVFRYEMTREQYDEALRELRIARDLALQKVANVANPVEKARLLHDYLIRNCDYYPSAEVNSRMFARSAYGVLVKHEAESEGYAIAYRYLLGAVGIECGEVVSEKMDCRWNYVKLDGHWYHVNVKEDDLCRKNGGEDDVQYKYFLISDSAMRERATVSWFTRGLPPATDTWYDNYNWVGTDKRDEKKKKRTTTSKRSKAEKDDRSILEKYRNHVAFMAQNQGCSLYCRGTIKIRVYFVDDSESKWGDAEREGFKRVVSSAIRKLLDDASGEAVTLTISGNEVSYVNRAVSSAVHPTGNARTWLDEIFGTTGLVEDQKRFRAAIDCDESPIVFAFNKNFRSCAATSEGESVVGRNHPEWSMVSYQSNFSEGVVVQTLVHELLHQFGAIDLYYPKEITAACEKYLGESIMNCGDDIDDLTRILIGWTTHFTDNVIKFLEATGKVTKEQVMKAREEEWKKKWA